MKCVENILNSIFSTELKKKVYFSCECPCNIEAYVGYNRHNPLLKIHHPIVVLFTVEHTGANWLQKDILCTNDLESFKTETSHILWKRHIE